MPHVHVLTSIPHHQPLRRSAVAFGNFDGVHLGHQALVRRLREMAREVGGQAVVLTFDPHPLVVLRREAAPRFLEAPAQRAALLAEAGADLVVLARFDAEFAAQSGETFMREVLFGAFDAAALLVGADARFGQGGAGDVSLLREGAARRGARIELFDAVVVGGERVSSTRIRQLIERGEVDHAARLLGRHVSITGEVTRGRQLGRTLGIPTANVVPDPGRCMPPNGVYVTTASIAGGPPLPAVTNIGTRPTVDDLARPIVETHILDFTDDLYGELVEIALHAPLRPEQRFASIDALVSQIRSDIRATRRYFETLSD